MEIYFSYTFGSQNSWFLNKNSNYFAVTLYSMIIYALQ